MKRTFLNERFQHVQCFFFASKFLRSKFTRKMQQIHACDQIVLIDIELRLQDLNNGHADLREHPSSCHRPTDEISLAKFFCTSEFHTRRKAKSFVMDNG